ncbi:MAG: hypothetical protein ACFFFC_11235 [Candidatus Thorarchaeota archaeon]
MADEFIDSTQTDDELNSDQVREIVNDVYQRGGLTPPYVIDFSQRDESETEVKIILKNECLHVVASNEPELKRAIGRYLTESTWPRSDWLLTTRAGLYTAVCCFLMITLAAFAASVSYLLPEMGYGVTVSASFVIAIVALWSSRQMAIKRYDLRRDFTNQMVELGCMTEYDAHDYEDTSSFAVHAGFLLIALGAVLALGLAMPFDLEAMWIILVEFVLLLVAALIVLFKSAFKSIDTNVCYEEVDSEGEADHEAIEDEEDNFENSEYLQAAYTDIIERMSLWDSLNEKHEDEIQEINARYSKTQYAQCRGVYDYVEEGVLFIDALDISEEAAKRFGAAVLATGSLHFYRKLNFTRRAIHGVAFFFGLVMLMVILLGGFMISMEFGIVSLVGTSIVFSKLWHTGWKQNEQVRRDLPLALQETRVFKDYELEFYRNHMFSTTSRFDFGFIIGFHLVLIFIGYLVLIWS